MTEGEARCIEELTLDAWPPLKMLLFDGWVLGFSHGYTRRANSVQPLYASSLPLADKISACEALYAEHGQGVTYKLTEHATDLDAALEQRGYVKEGQTSVQVLAGLDFEPGSGDVAVSETLTPEWLSEFNRLSAIPASLQSAERLLLEKILPAHCFGSLVLEGETVGVGLAVAERGHVGLFDIVVDPRVRNQGLGRRLCAGLLAWGRRRGAHTGYLAVVADNAPARHLYAKMGYREAYTYWYRAKIG